MANAFIELFKDHGVKHPIVSAPMAGSAGGRLAAEVSLAGGLGFIGLGVLSADAITKELELARSLLRPDNSALLPVGVGFINWILSPDRLEVALAFRPSAVWFAFGEYEHLVPVVRETSPGTKIFVQVQSVLAA